MSAFTSVGVSSSQPGGEEDDPLSLFVDICVSLTSKKDFSSPPSLPRGSAEGYGACRTRYCLPDARRAPLSPVLYEAVRRGGRRPWRADSPTMMWASRLASDLIERRPQPSLRLICNARLARTILALRRHRPSMRVFTTGSTLFASAPTGAHPGPLACPVHRVSAMSRPRSPPPRRSQRNVVGSSARNRVTPAVSWANNKKLRFEPAWRARMSSVRAAIVGSSTMPASARVAT